MRPILRDAARFKSDLLLPRLACRREPVCSQAYAERVPPQAHAETAPVNLLNLK
jgi:hypothetical protein